MGNADDHDEYDEAPLTERCGYCRTPMINQRKGTVFCGRRCKELAREKRKRDRARVDVLREKYPDADLSLQELHARATPPGPATDQADEAGQDADEDGYSRQADDGPGTWSSAWRLHEAEQAIRARYERRMQPYQATLKRNPGVRPAGLVELERQRNAELAGIIRAHDRRAEADRARRREPQRINEAHERQNERDALRALAHDLPGGSRRYAPPEQTGRATRDIWNW